MQAVDSSLSIKVVLINFCGPVYIVQHSMKPA